MGRPILNVDYVIKRLIEVHGDNVILDIGTYVNATTKARFIDQVHGEFWAKPTSVLQGARHYLNRYHRLTEVDARQLLKRVHGDQVVIDWTTFVNLSTKMRFVDSDYGEWWTLPGNVLFLGCSHSMRGHQKTNEKLRITSKECSKRIKKKHGGNVVLDMSTYVDLGTKARFIDIEYGDWWAVPNNVCQGTQHPERGRLQMLKSSKRITWIKHWKTGANLPCTGSYEVAFVKWCNFKQIDFDWQVCFLMTDNVTCFACGMTMDGSSVCNIDNVKHFEMCGRKYYIDAYIKTGEFVNKFIEIKGTWARDSGYVSRQKWEWFHKTHPNSELWTKTKLLKFGIL